MTREKNRSSEPTDKDLLTLAEDLINQQSTMTMATAAQNQAWAAPVYYVFYKSAFYFFSDPQTRHIAESTESGQASAAIYAFAFTWREIRGIQMTGMIEQISVGFEAIKVIRAYMKKFPFTKEFFNPNQVMDMASFEKRFRVKLYKFIPSMVYYLDNKIRFGFREEVLFH